MEGLRRVWRPGWPVPVGQIWSHWRRGAGDPTYRIESGRHWRGLDTPDGVATLCAWVEAASGEVVGEAWGAGASWVLEQLPTMLGASDDEASTMPIHHEAVRVAAKRSPHWRVGRGGVVWAALMPAIIEQKVTGQEAFSGYRRLVRRFGVRAPGPGETLDLWVPPTPEGVRRVPSWEWLTMSIDRGRSTPLLRAARVADSLQRTISLPGPAAERVLRSVPGIGVWTAAEVRARAHGDPDAVAFGDYHVARSIGWALIGEEIDDARLAELLEPYRGHRYRVQRLLELAGYAHPRRGPRMAPRTHLPVR